MLDKKKVLILYEHKVREFNYKMILKHLLENEGFDVEIASIYFNAIRKIYSFKPDIVILPWGYITQFVRAAYTVNSRVDFVILYEEQLISKESNYFEKYDFKIGSFFITWGRYFIDNYLSTVKDYSKDVGNPRLDIYFEPFNKLLKNNYREKYGIGCKKIILIPSSFSLVFYDYNYIKKLSIDIPNILESYYETWENLREFIKILNFFLEKNKRNDFVMIIRPHPGKVYSEEKYFKSNLVNDERVKIISEGTIQEWISIADAVVTWTSTSIIDSLIQKKPSLVLSPKKFEYYDMDLFKFANKIQDHYQFAESLQEILYGNSYKIENYWNVQELNRYLEYIVGKSDGKSFYRIVDVIKNLDKFKRKVNFTSAINRIGFIEQNILKNKEKVKSILSKTKLIKLTKWGNLINEFVDSNEFRKIENEIKEEI